MPTEKGEEVLFEQGMATMGEVEPKEEEKEGFVTEGEESGEPTQIQLFEEITKCKN